MVSSLSKVNLYLNFRYFLFVEFCLIPLKVDIIIEYLTPLLKIDAPGIHSLTLENIIMYHAYIL